MGSGGRQLGTDAIRRLSATAQLLNSVIIFMIIFHLKNYNYDHVSHLKFHINTCCYGTNLIYGSITWP